MLKQPDVGHKGSPVWSTSAFRLLCLGMTFGQTMLARGEELTWEYSVQVSAQIQSSPPSILFSWPQDVATLPGYYAVSRKAQTAQNWGPAIVLPGSRTNYLDTTVTVGVSYEYQFYKYTTNHVGYGYICSGIQLPLLDSRGKIVLLVDQAYATDLAIELGRLQQDLVGDGWTVLRHDVARNTSVTDVKGLIKADYDADPSNVKALFLFGRIPVPYAGEIAPDGHPDDHLGAWPADVYYGNFVGVWTDTTVSNTTAWDPRNRNVPGDGKFDQSEIPGPVALEIGRVDFDNMPGIDTNGAATFPSERELLRGYLNKDHNYRHKLFSVPARGLVFNETGDRSGEAFAADAWRNYAPLLGAPLAQPLKPFEFMPILRTNAYLWAYATSGASRNQMSDLGGSGDWGEGGTSVDFVQTDIQAVFTMFMGSSIGDWDEQDNLMRAVLATPTHGLSCAYAGRPHWYFHYMGIGETLGYCARLTQNNHADGLYQNQSNAFPGFVHIALMGDPTLRLYTVAPPSGLHGASAQQGMQLSWSPSVDNVAGYHVYRAANPAGPFARLTTAPVQATAFLDVSNAGGTGTYMVRAIKLETSPSGSFFNPSQGAFITFGPPPTAPAFTQIPASQTNLTSSKVSLSCAVTGTAPMRFQWRFNGQNLTDDGHFVGATSDTLTILSAQPSDAGDYSVVAANDTGAVTSSPPARMTVSAPRATVYSVTLTPNPLTAGTLSGSGSFVAGSSQTVVAIPSSGYTFVTWMEDGIVVSSSPSYSLEVVGNRNLVANFSAQPPSTYTINLTVSWSAAGTVSGNGTFAAGSSVTVQATANPGFTFLNWSEDGREVGALSGYTFALNVNRNLEARFKVSSFKALTGTYNGLFAETNGITQNSSGFFTVTTTAKGACSGSLLLGGKRIPMSGQLDASGKFSKVLKRGGKSSPLTVIVQLDLTAGTDRLEGSVSDGVWVAELAGDRAVFDGKKSVPTQAGCYTMIIPGTAGTEPVGDSYGSMTVDKAGRIRFSGALADGTKLTQAVPVSKNGDWPFYVSLYQGQGSMLNWLSFSNSATDGPAGEVFWLKSAMAASKYYPGGFIKATSAAGWRYIPPAGGSKLLNLVNAKLVLSGGGLTQSITNLLALGARNRVTSDRTNNLSLNFSAATGLFTGRTKNPATGKPISFSGVVFQNSNSGRGFFLGKSQSGEVQFDEN